VTDLLNSLSELLAGRPGPEAAARIESALDHAARAATPERSRQLDREAVRALRGGPDLPAVLEAIRLDKLTALLERCARQQGTGVDPDPGARTLAGDVLDLVRHPAVVRRIEASDVDAWSKALLALIEASHLTLGPLFRQRAEAYGSKVLFDVPRPGGNRRITWRQAASRVDFLARGLLSLDSSDTPAPIAILSENRIEMALVDLACLTSGLVNVMVPSNSTEADVGYMLRHSRAGTVIVSTKQQLRKVLINRESLPDLKRIIMLDPQAAAGHDALTLDELTARAVHIPSSLVTQRSEAVKPDDVATVMYTSGTTGMPKAIQFSQRNLVFKRFARGLALPEIGDTDVFLCYLPLCHTFGRFLEMLGCIFWGATYCFLESPSVQALVCGMRRHRPSVFISVPKKWMQLYDAISSRADPLTASDEELLAATHEVTGGRLRWGLSAAGYLDPDIFRFFQRQSTELLSGFGMTEATGGITMTPPGHYENDSLGTALPGIELKLAEDGELLLRGPYVMVGYLDPPDGEPSFDEEGWLHSGDLMEQTPDGHYRLVDRKKEIYKNVKGETIAPQRIENQFRDMESVGRAFLVGDHREFNTLLIYPNPNYEELDFAALPAEEIRDHFRSLVVSVNKFLAPYERVVDFALIDRDLDPERGELTAKGTARRKKVVQNFAETIQTLYRRTNLQIGDVELTFPNWLFQTLGLTAQDIRIAEGRLYLPSTGRSLTVRRQSDRLTQVGSAIYRHPEGALNLGPLMTSPRLWLGNGELVDFVPLENSDRSSRGRTNREIQWRGFAELNVVTDEDRARLETALGRFELNLLDLDHAARALASNDEEAAALAVRVMDLIVNESEGPLAQPARTVLARAADSDSPEVRRLAFLALVPAQLESRLADDLRRFLAADPNLLDERTRLQLAEETLSAAKLDAFVDVAQATGKGDEASYRTEPLAISLLWFLSAYGAAHPISYRRLRYFLTRMSLFAKTAKLRDEATAAIGALQNGFRAWLGPTAQIAVDPETGDEYRWDDVVVFDEQVPEEDRTRQLGAIKETAVLREAFFLFSRGALIRLNDVPPGGVFIRLLGSRHGKSVYRITVQTRTQESYDLAVNVNHSLKPDDVQEEIHWLILSGDPGVRDPLVEDFGGFWPDQDLWSEEFISGETLDRALQRLSRRDDEGERLKYLWPFLARSTLAAYIDFWNRSENRWEIADPSMSNVVVPTEDFQTGTRLVSLSARRPHGGLPAMLRSFMEEFAGPAQEQYPVLGGLVGWETILSALLDVVGETQGLALLQELLDQRSARPEGLARALESFVPRIRETGFTPARLHFAIRRYRRWEELSEDATPQARGRTVQQLFDTYGLQRLARTYPEVRVRFFRETVFRQAAAPLTDGLEDLIQRFRRRELAQEELIDAVADLRGTLELGPDDDYFLARVSLPHLRPEDSAGFVRSYQGGKHQSEIVVQLQDHDDHPFRVRHALNPKEVERLHRLFLAAKLPVRFRLEHQFLVAISDRGQIIGGIFYEIAEDVQSAHLEKIVVADLYRRKGVADGLMQEFFNRLRAAGIKAVTTGFFRPEYFYGYGFRIEKRYAGLVKSLEEEPELPGGDGVRVDIASP